MNDKDKIQAPLHSFLLPAYNEIPDVGLYLDQVTKYINGWLNDFPEMQVTPSMIANYVKLKLVAKATKKAYSREQIAYFIFIAMAKTVLSMDHIRLVFETQAKQCSPEQGYEYFRRDLQAVLSSFYSPSVREAGNDRKGTEEKRMVHNVCVTIAHKMYLDRYFDQTGVPAADSEDSEQD
jgi:hypothetical protein